MTLREFLKDKTLPVKVRSKYWMDDEYLNILYLGSDKAFYRDEENEEDSWPLADVTDGNWQLYVEPKLKKKYWRWRFNNLGLWMPTPIYLDESGRDTTGLAYSNYWETADKIKIEDDFVEVDS